MAAEIIINTNPYETRVALLENGQVSEIFIEKKQEEGIVGNIYKGRIIKVLPGMQAAFVDIGMAKAGFLYVSDVDLMDAMGAGPEKIFEDVEEKVEEAEAGGEAEDNEDEEDKIEKKNHKFLPIEELLKEGQEILVQVSKDPIGIKGARITSFISLPGRYLVYTPTVEHIGISRRIEDEKERKRLKKIISQIRKPGSGYILRTAAEDKEFEDFVSDANFLSKLWDDLRFRSAQIQAPALVYSDLDIIFRSVRDLFTEDVSKLVIDSPEEYENLKEFLNNYLPDYVSRLELYVGEESIFEAYDIETEITRALGRKIWLKSGGYIVIDRTEALVAIDVNTGRFVGKRNQDDTILKTNLEAVKEIVYQLRLRNIGGLIIIDFIDMKREEDKEKVFHTLEHALKTDRSRTTVLKLSELGIVEMTRKRVRESLDRVLCQPCPYCEGRGIIKSVHTICHEIFREIQKNSSLFANKKTINLNVHPDIAAVFFDEESSYIYMLETKLNKKIIINQNFSLHHEQYKIY